MFDALKFGKGVLLSSLSSMPPLPVPKLLLIVLCLYNLRLACVCCKISGRYPQISQVYMVGLGFAWLVSGQATDRPKIQILILGGSLVTVSTLSQEEKWESYYYCLALYLSVLPLLLGRRDIWHKTLLLGIRDTDTALNSYLETRTCSLASKT